MGPVAVIPLVLFCGFFASFDDIPSYISWFSYVSYVRYTFEGSMISIYGLDRQRLECTKDYCHFRYPKKFLEQMSMSGDLETYLIDAGALSLIFILLRIVVYFVLRVKLLASRWFWISEFRYFLALRELLWELDYDILSDCR